MRGLLLAGFLACFASGFYFLLFRDFSELPLVGIFMALGGGFVSAMLKFERWQLRRLQAELERRLRERAEALK